MGSKITPQQREDLNASHGQPVPVEDDEARKVYYLVEADYLHTSHEHLQALIQQGINARHIPADQAEAELRRYAAALDSRSP